MENDARAREGSLLRSLQQDQTGLSSKMRLRWQVGSQGIPPQMGQIQQKNELSLELC